MTKNNRSRRSKSRSRKIIAGFFHQYVNFLWLLKLSDELFQQANHLVMRKLKIVPFSRKKMSHLNSNEKDKNAKAINEKWITNFFSYINRTNVRRKKSIGTLACACLLQVTIFNLIWALIQFTPSVCVTVLYQILFWHFAFFWNFRWDEHENNPEIGQRSNNNSFYEWSGARTPHHTPNSYGKSCFYLIISSNQYNKLLYVAYTHQLTSYTLPVFAFSLPFHPFWLCVFSLVS